MYTVLLNSKNEVYGFHSFYSKFIEICNEHRKGNRALVFAFILYDFENPQLSKVLKDEDYWRSLNKTSGQYLTVFSLYYKPNVRLKNRNYQNDFDPRIRTKSFLTSVTDSNDPSEGSNLLIDKYFGKNINVQYPAVLFFQTDSEKIIDYTLIELDEKEIEKAFLELQNYIYKAVEALKLITDENKGNLQEIFNNVETSVKAARIKKVTARTVRKVTSLAELGVTIAGLG